VGVFGSIGFPELIMIFIIALLLFGPRKLPEIGRSLGKAMGEFRRATNDLQRSLEEEVATDELRQTRKEFEQAVSPLTGTAAIPAAMPPAEGAATVAAEPPQRVVVEPAPAAPTATPETSAGSATGHGESL
jgi:TatA/E family protein of Tat protein translocase